MSPRPFALFAGTEPFVGDARCIWARPHGHGAAQRHSDTCAPRVQLDGRAARGRGGRGSPGATRQHDTRSRGRAVRPSARARSKTRSPRRLLARKVTLGSARRGTPARELPWTKPFSRDITTATPSRPTNPRVLKRDDDRRGFLRPRRASRRWATVARLLNLSQADRGSILSARAPTASRTRKCSCTCCPWRQCPWP